MTATATQQAKPASFRDLYDEHFALVWRSLRRLGVPDGDVPDAVQDVFLVVYRKLATFEGRSKLTTWLYGICVRVASDRRRKAHRRYETVDQELVTVEQEPTECTSEEIERREGLALLEAVLDSMPEEQRVVFTMFELEEMSGDEIAEALGIPTGTVRSRLRLARETFRRASKRLQARERAPAAALALFPAAPPIGTAETVWAKIAQTLPAGAGPVATAVPTIGTGAAGVGLGALKTASVGAALGLLTAGGVTAVQSSDAVPPSSPVAVVSAPRAAAARAPAPIEEPSTTVDPIPTAARAAVIAPSAPSAADVSEPEASETELAAESRMLEHARRLLEGNKASLAIAQLDMMDRRFPGGGLREERAALRVEALRATGDRAKAESAAKRFDQRYPKSPHRDRVTQPGTP